MSLRSPLAPSTLLLAFLAACASPGATLEAPAPTLADAPPTAAPDPRPGDTRREITPEDVRLRVGLLAHDSMRGRETGTREKRLAGDYLAREVERLGLLPGGDGGTYFQAVPLERRVTRVEAEFQGAGTSSASLPLTAEELVLISGLGGLPATSRSAVAGELIFGGHLFDPRVREGELTLQQVAGAAVIVRMDPPEGVDPDGVPPRMELGLLFGPQSPAAAVILVAEGDLEDFWDHARDVALKGAVALQGGEGPQDLPPFFLISPEAVERLVGTPLSEARQPRRGLGTLAVRMDASTQRYEDRNVVAIYPGADPARAGEYMTLGAHYDHVGVGTPVEGDSIYNGADDNASGTAAILEVAEYLAHLPEADRPARSVLFIWHAAEESGLLGSEFFTDNPTVARNRMVAHINMDMVGRNHPDSLFLVGSRRLSTEYGALVEEANAALATPFILDYTYDSPDHPERLYCRSDHWNFARYGIPVVKMGSGLHDDYHKPSDTVDRLDHGKVARVAELATAITLRVADLPAPPRIDGPRPSPDEPCQG